MVDDIEAAYARLKNKVELVHEPKLLPWGNRIFQFRDPEGTAISLFMPHRRREGAVRRAVIVRECRRATGQWRERGGGCVKTLCSQATTYWPEKLAQTRHRLRAHEVKSIREVN
jgi:hypothetical protein